MNFFIFTQPSVRRKESQKIQIFHLTKTRLLIKSSLAEVHLMLQLIISNNFSKGDFPPWHILNLHIRNSILPEHIFSVKHIYNATVSQSDHFSTRYFPTRRFANFQTYCQTTFSQPNFCTKQHLSSKFRLPKQQLQ